MGAVFRKFPFESEIAFVARLRVGRDDGHEQHTCRDLLPNLLIPGVTTDEFAFIEPNLDARRPQRRANAPRGLRVLRCVGQEDRLVFRSAHVPAARTSTSVPS